jgi:hypothetical protein
LKTIKLLLAIFVVLPIILILIRGIIKPKESFNFKNKFRPENVVESGEYEPDIHLVHSITYLIVMIAIFIWLIFFL